MKFIIGLLIFVIFLVFGGFLVIATTSFSGSTTVQDNKGNEVSSYDVTCAVTLDNKFLEPVSITDWDCDEQRVSRCSRLFSFFGIISDEGKATFRLGQESSTEDYEVREDPLKGENEVALLFDFSCVPEGENNVEIQIVNDDGNIVDTVSDQISIGG